VLTSPAGWLRPTCEVSKVRVWKLMSAIEGHQLKVGKWSLCFWVRMLP
jgi:hypothetical protein